MDISFLTTLDMPSFTTGCIVGVVVTLVVRITISKSISGNRVTQRNITTKGDVIGGNKSK